MGNHPEYDHLMDSAQGTETREDVIREIVDEIDAGDAHLMTRNEVVEFVRWLVEDENSAGLGNADHNINSVIYEFMESGDWSPGAKSFAEAAAKKFFVLKGYER